LGPRAERKFFVDQIITHAPYYSLVFRVQPGITSLGMVKYGYASDGRRNGEAIEV
jgi:lipopolysaccharide/colanic/teichoic acid biosynthesis glycosyltransferase